MPEDTEFRDYVLDQLSGLGRFETKNLFGGTAVLRNGVAFAKIKHGSLWLKADDSNINDFLKKRRWFNIRTARTTVASSTSMKPPWRF